ncbi:MAG: caspase family protein [Pseudomonadota bacterium]
MRSITSVFKSIVFLACCIQVATTFSAAAMGPPAAKKSDPKRIALLIGNENYAATVGPLANPGNDVNLIASALEEIGFDRRNIRTVTNANRVATLQAIDEYANKVAAAGPDAVAFFYYSGHGAASQQDRRNYIIPTEVKALDRTVWYQAIALDDVVTQLATRAPSAAHFVIFDACRNLLKMPTKGKKGFVPMAEKSGMLIAFSTDPGETASDEGAGAGPYASALAAELVKPGQDHLDLFQNVKERVHQTTSGQRPWERNGLLKRVYLNGSAPNNSSSDSSDAAAAWQAVKNSKDPEVLKAFTKRFGGTFFADLASRKLKQLSFGSTQPVNQLKNITLTAPKWKRTAGFDRVSRAETQQLLGGTTVTSLSQDRWQWYFASNGTYSGKNSSGGATSGKWRIGQNGIIYLEGGRNQGVNCPVIIKHNSALLTYQWTTQRPCSATTPVKITLGNHTTR